MGNRSLPCDCESISVSVELSARRYILDLMSAIYQVPLGQTHPLVNSVLGPLPIRPPLQTEFGRIIDSGYTNLQVGKLPVKAAEGAPGVKIRGHQQETVSDERPETPACSADLLPGRKAWDGASNDLRCLWQALHPACGEFPHCLLLDVSAPGNF